MSTASAIEIEESMTLEEYLAMEEISPIRHEFHAGRVYAMAGGSPTHADIIQNVAFALGKQLEGKRCRVTGSEQRVRIEASNTSIYPDVLIKCPPQRYSEMDPHALVNPSLIVEVFSPSTERYDRGDKFHLYEQIPELLDCLFVSQYKVLVLHFRRIEDGGWNLHSYNRRDQVIAISNLQISISIAEIYRDVDVPSGLTVVNPAE